MESSAEEDRRKLVAYHKAVLNGRHPRSFPPTGKLWQYLKVGNERLQKLEFGERLYHVNDRLLYGSDDASSRAEPPSDAGDAFVPDRHASGASSATTASSAEPAASKKPPRGISCSLPERRYSSWCVDAPTLLLEEKCQRPSIRL